eukprot:95539-Pyramimonas_sp.AAC.1
MMREACGLKPRPQGEGDKLLGLRSVMGRGAEAPATAKDSEKAVEALLPAITEECVLRKKDSLNFTAFKRLKLPAVPGLEGHGKEDVWNLLRKSSVVFA